MKSFLSQLLSLTDFASFTPNHSLLVFFGHVFLVGDALVKLVPGVVLALEKKALFNFEV